MIQLQIVIIEKQYLVGYTISLEIAGANGEQTLFWFKGNVETTSYLCLFQLRFFFRFQHKAYWFQTTQTRLSLYVANFEIGFLACIYLDRLIRQSIAEPGVEWISSFSLRVLLYEEWNTRRFCYGLWLWPVFDWLIKWWLPAHIRALATSVLLEWAPNWNLDSDQ